MRKSLFATLILILTPILAETAGNAYPKISTYVTSGTLNKSVQMCLDQMKGAANQAGLSASPQIVMDKNGNAGDFHTESSNLSLHFTARCNSVSNTWSMALSGTDPSSTYAKFREIADFIYKK
jgi:hypothetical protein